MRIIFLGDRILNIPSYTWDKALQKHMENVIGEEVEPLMESNLLWPKLIYDMSSLGCFKF